MMMFSPARNAFNSMPDSMFLPPREDVDGQVITMVERFQRLRHAGRYRVRLRPAPALPWAFLMLTARLP